MIGGYGSPRQSLPIPKGQRLGESTKFSLLLENLQAVEEADTDRVAISAGFRSNIGRFPLVSAASRTLQGGRAYTLFLLWVSGAM